ncbi:UNVERIFIED_CONTAM: hypothetical protein K2H54_042651 [Gekko kuhli]
MQSHQCSRQLSPWDWATNAPTDTAPVIRPLAQHLGLGHHHTHSPQAAGAVPRIGLPAPQLLALGHRCCTRDRAAGTTATCIRSQVPQLPTSGHQCCAQNQATSGAAARIELPVPHLGSDCRCCIQDQAAGAAAPHIRPPLQPPTSGHLHQATSTVPGIGPLVARLPASGHRRNPRDQVTSATTNELCLMCSFSKHVEELLGAEGGSPHLLASCGGKSAPSCQHKLWLELGLT